MVARKRKISVKERVRKITSAIFDTDAKYRPDLHSYESNKKDFLTQWKLYQRKINSTIRACIHDMGYSTDVDAVHTDKITAETAQNYLSMVRSEITSNHNFVPPHYTDTLNGIIRKNRKFKTDLERLRLKNPDSISKTISIIQDDLPDELVKELRKMPFQHPAIGALKVDSVTRKKIKKYRKRVLKSKKQSIVSLPYSFITRFVESVYQAGYQSTWSDLLIALAFATGRRAFEICSITTFAVGKKDSTLEVSALGKKRRNSDGTRSSKKYHIPVVILTPEQCIELIAILRNKLKAEHPSVDLTISRKFNDKLGSPITDAFAEFKKLCPVEFIEPHFEEDSPDEETIQEESPVEELTQEERERQLELELARKRKRRNVFTFHNITRSAYSFMAYHFRRDHHRTYEITEFVRSVLKHAETTKSETYLCVEVDFNDAPGSLPIAVTLKVDKSLLAKLEDYKIASSLMDYDMANMGSKTMLVHAKILNHLRDTGCMPTRSEVEKHMRGKEDVEKYLKLLKKKRVELHGF